MTINRRFLDDVRCSGGRSKRLPDAAGRVRVVNGAILFESALTVSFHFTKWNIQGL